MKVGVVKDGSMIAERQRKSGFTLIELSIVLVIIGLLVGGMLVGRDLIAGAETRAQVSQFEKFNAARNTFQVKYNCIPGDCTNAATFGFAARGTDPGQGDGDGIISGSRGGAIAYWSQNGEPLLFWRDLSEARLIPDSFSTAMATVNFSSSDNNLYLPKSKVDNNSYIFVLADSNLSKNYYNLASDIGSLNGAVYPASKIRVSSAFSIDQKMDDGYPQSGKITAQRLSGEPLTPSQQLVYWTDNSLGPAYTTPVTPSTSTCYDNNATNGQPQHYTMSVNGGSSLACTLLIEFQ